MDFKRAIRYCDQARSRDITRGNLQDFLTVDGCVVTTDGHRLHIAVVDDVDLLERRVFTEESVEQIANGFAPDLFAIEKDHYPAIDSIVQMAEKQSTPESVDLRVDGKELQDAFQAVLPAPQPKTLVVRAPKRKKSDPKPPKPSVVLNFLPNGYFEIWGGWEAVKSPVRLVYATGSAPRDNYRMGFNMKYFRQALSGMRGKLRIRNDGPLSPILIESDEQRAIIMPMRES